MWIPPEGRLVTVSFGALKYGVKFWKYDGPARVKLTIEIKATKLPKKCLNAMIKIDETLVPNSSCWLRLYLSMLCGILRLMYSVDSRSFPWINLHQIENIKKCHVVQFCDKTGNLFKRFDKKLNSRLKKITVNLLIFLRFSGISIIKSCTFASIDKISKNHIKPRIKITKIVVVC